MAHRKPAISFDDIIQEGRRKRKAEELAQEILGKGHRSSAPTSGASNGRRGGLAGAGGSLASRVGVTKRTSSPVTPLRSLTPRGRPSQAPPHLSRPAANPRMQDNYRPSQPVPLSADPVSNVSQQRNGYGYGVQDMSNGFDGAEISIRGAAALAPYIIVAQNFAPGTTAADIESVMQSVGGELISCKLVSASPTVIAEMTFVERSGADAVISTFNNKKADGRLLHVYIRNGQPSNPGFGAANTRHKPTPGAMAASPEPAPIDEETMEVDDELAASRQAEDQVREERRRAPRDAEFPRGPRSRDDYDRGPRRAEPAYQDGRFGFGGGGGGGGGVGSGGGGYDNRRGRYDGGMYSDGMRRGGQNWRP